MQFKKGKVFFGFKDTWQMDEQLSKVILAGVSKFKEVINEEGGHRKGVPASISSHLHSEGVITYGDDYNLSDGDYATCEAYFDYVIDEIIYAFSDNEPDIMDYDFEYKPSKELSDETGMVSFNLECTNQSESDRYSDDKLAYNKRCLEGRKLFAEHFHALWW